MSTLTTAWQAALAGEHRAVFGYGVLGPHLRGAEQVLAVACSDAHEQLRDRTVGALGAAGGNPVTAEIDYPDLFPIPDAATARAVAIGLEDNCAAAWRYAFLVAASMSGTVARSVRTSAQAALTASAVRAAKWRVIVDPDAATVAFPGIG
jgi:hypothetical protein